MTLLTAMRTIPLHRSGAYLQQSDTELILACQRNDHEAFACLLERYQLCIHGWLRRLMPEQRDNSDLAQEAFIRMWRSINGLRNPAAFRTWLKQIVTNMFYDELRRRGNHIVVSMDAPTPFEDGDQNPYIQIPDRSALPDQLAEHRELGKAIDGALAKLSYNSRMMIVLRDCNGLSYREIAVATEAKPGTVKSRIARARRKLQEKLLPFVRTSEYDVEAPVLCEAS